MKFGEVIQRLRTTLTLLWLLAFRIILDIEFLVIANRRVGERHQLVEHREFEFQLDAVHHGFQCRFDLVETGILHAEEDNVHGNDDRVDPYQLHHHLPCSAMIYRFEELYGRVNVHARYNEFLYAEGGHLQTLHLVENRKVFMVIGRVGSVGEHGGRNVEEDGIDDDHSQDTAKDFLFSNHQMQPRIQHHRLPCHHAIPADRDYRYRHIDVRYEPEEFQEEPKRMQHASVTGYEQRPEVQPSMAFESEEDLDVQFHHVIPCDCREGRYGHECGLLEWDQLRRGAIILLSHVAGDLRTRGVRGRIATAGVEGGRCEGS